MNRIKPVFPAVTVLMPVYNGARFLREQIYSILAQQCVETRLVILDDGSTDNSFELATELATKDDRIILVDRQPNAGLIAAVERLLTYVDTPYFAMSDQDDVWDPDKLHRSIAALDRTQTTLVYSDVRIIDYEGTILENSYWTSRAIRPVGGRNLLPVIFRNPIIGHTIVAIGDVAVGLREFPRDLIYHEVWIAAAAARLGPIGYLDTQLGSYRIHSSNVVGPIEARFLAKVIRKLREPERIRIRQLQRIAALAAVAEDRPEYRSLAELYRQGLIGRVCTLSRFFRELGRWRRTLGYRTILKEALLHMLIGPVSSSIHAR